MVSWLDSQGFLRRMASTICIVPHSKQPTSWRVLVVCKLRFLIMLIDLCRLIKRMPFAPKVYYAHVNSLIAAHTDSDRPTNLQWQDLSTVDYFIQFNSCKNVHLSDSSAIQCSVQCRNYPMPYPLLILFVIAHVMLCSFPDSFSPFCKDFCLSFDPMYFWSCHIILILY